MAGRRQRADQVLTDQGLAESRSQAQALILAGRVFLGDRRIEKPGQPVADDASLSLRGKVHPYVSRGGLKLAHGIDQFGLDPTNAVAIDIGASTGGFTDVLLGKGARRVYAVDVGHGQLAWSLRQDDRVRVLERLNARHLTPEHIAEDVTWLVCDASFISLKLVLPPALALVSSGASLVALIKPQFEVGRDAIGKGGVVRDPDLQDAVCKDISSWLGDAMGWTVRGLTESPIQGPKGNREFLIYATKP
ncbi:MAG: TlyA family RNA methyltransferase [Geminicoccaceae bacterium]